MQTIATLAKRLDMSAEEAVETLRKLRFEVEGVDSSITDDQMDMLIDIDEDASAFDRFLQTILKKEEQERKRNERLQVAAKRAAAKRKAEKEKEDKDREEKEKHEEEESAKKKALLQDAEEETEEEQEGEPAVEVQEDAEVEEKEISEAEPPLVVETEVEVVVQVEAPAEVEPPQPAKPKPMAEIIREEPKKPEPPKILIGAAYDATGQVVEIIRADGTVASAAELELADTHVPRDGEDEVVRGALAEAELREEEEERRRSKKPGRPLPVPDPEVVAKVIREAHERSIKKNAKQQQQQQQQPHPHPHPGQPQTAVRPETIDKESLFGRGDGKKSGKTAKKRQKRAERVRLLEENMRRDAAAAVREFQSGGAFGMPKRRKKRRSHDDESEGTEDVSGGTIEVEESMTVEQLADAMDMAVSDVILILMDEDVLATKNQSLELDMIRKVAESQGFEVQLVIPEEEEIVAEEPDAPEDLVLRPPVITVMGHVDHGKTSLLDFVRRANVVAGEAGGITQHIAAYEVEMPSGRVVFLDTPGHEAFTQMRARGTKVTDVVVLVVAADDGVKPQTIEALDHAKAAEVPVVVAINKCDKPDAQPDRVRQELTQYELLDEAWGGKTIMRNISAKTGEGVPELLEMLVLESQMLELRANPKKRARGAVIESEISRGQGAVAWVLVQTGTLRVGDVFLCGRTFGRVRSMNNSRGEQIHEAGPSTPVLVTGFNTLPDAGDQFLVAVDERAARSVAEKRAAISRQKRGPAVKHITLEDFHSRMLMGDQKTLRVIIKADVQGSVDVFQSSLTKIGNEEVNVQIVHAGVGSVNESDILLASASDSVIIGFHVTPNARALKLAEQEGVEIRTYRVIYEAIQDVHNSLEGMLTPDKKEVVTGHAEVRQVFRSSAIGNIAGSFQVDGETHRGAPARLIRDGVIIHEGRIGTVRRGKDDVRSVLTGFECGIKLERYDDIQAGDVIETYRVEEVAKTLE